MNEPRTVKERLIALEVRMTELMTNHIPHLEAKIDRIQWLLITTLVSIIVGLISLYVKMR